MKGVLMMWSIDARIFFGASKPVLLKPGARHCRSTSANRGAVLVEVLAEGRARRHSRALHLAEMVHAEQDHAVAFRREQPPTAAGFLHAEMPRGRPNQGQIAPEAISRKRVGRSRPSRGCRPGEGRQPDEPDQPRDA